MIWTEFEDYNSVTSPAAPGRSLFVFQDIQSKCVASVIQHKGAALVSQSEFPTREKFTLYCIANQQKKQLGIQVAFMVLDWHGTPITD